MSEDKASGWKLQDFLHDQQTQSDPPVESARTAEQPISILEIIDSAKAQESARRQDAVGQMVNCVLNAASPDGVFRRLAGQFLNGYISETRKKKITMLAEAFGAERLELKKYLRAPAQIFHRRRAAVLSDLRKASGQPDHVHHHRAVIRERL
jgi:hypothetical protein